MTVEGRTCRRRTTNPTGWCGRCAGIAATAAPGAQSEATATVAGPGPDPLAAPTDTLPAWEMPATTHEIERLARSTRTDPDVLDAIAAHATEQAGETSAGPADHRERWEYQKILRKLSNNPSVRPQTLLQLASSGHGWGAALANPALEGETLSAAAAVNPWQAAHNPNASPELLSHLYRSAAADDTATLAQVARNLNCPPEILTEAVMHENRSVRIWALQNPNCPPTALEHAAALYAAKKTTSGDAEWAVANPSFPPHLLSHYAGHPDRSVRRGVAANPHTPTGTLAALAEDPNNLVRRAAARNQSTPTSSAGQIGDTDPQWLNRRAVAARADAPTEVLDRLAEDPDHRVRAAVAAHPNTPANRLTGLAADPHPQVRKAAARNHNTTAAGKTAAGLLAD